MKIWMLTTEFPPFYGGGISTYCVNTVKMLSENNHEITVILPDSNLDAPCLLETVENYKLFRFKPGIKEIYKSLGYMAALSYDFADCVEDLIEQVGEPDIIESQEYSAIAYFLLQRKKQLNPKLLHVPIVLNLHSPKFIIDEVGQASIYKFPDYWIGEMERFSLKAADMLISPSQFLIDELSKRLDGELANYKIVPNPYQSKEFHNDTIYLSEEMVYFGRVQYLKGLDQLLKRLSLFWDKGLKIPLRVIGGDSFFPPKNSYYIEFLSKKYKKYVDQNLIRFEGIFSPEEAHKIIQTAKVVFVPSLFENFPYAVVEAMSLKKVVFTTIYGGQREIITDGYDGFLFSYEDDSFREKFEGFLKLTDNEINILGERAKKRIEEICNYNTIHSQKINAWSIAIKNRTHISKEYPFIRSIERKDQPTYDGESGLLSIVIPYYNMGNWIKETLDSLININYVHSEIILVNDGSNDPFSIELLNDLEVTYPIKIVHKLNGGLSSARNEGVKYAKGEYLAFLDADDLVHPNYYSKAIEILRNYNNVSFVGAWAQYFEGSDSIWPTWNPEPPFFFMRNTINTSGLVYKRDDFRKYGLNDPDMIYGMEDYESAIRMVKNGCRGVVISEPYFIYRIRPDSMSRQFNFDNQMYLYRLITEKHKDVLEKYGPDIFNIVNSNGPSHLYDNPTWNLPPVGFVNSNNEISQVNFDNSMDIPAELKQKLFQLWRSKKFKKMLKLGFKLKLDRFF